MTMTLPEKGPIVPPPALAPVLQPLSVVVREWRGVRAATHWAFDAPDEVDGADFYVGDQELGHIHLDGWVHIPASPPLRRALIEAKLARPFRWGARDEGWIEYFVASKRDAEHAQWLFRLNYDRLRGTVMAKLVERARARAITARSRPTA